MLQHFKKKVLKEQIMGQKVTYFWPKSYFLENLTIGLTTVSNHAMSFQKNRHRANHENKVA